MTEEVSLYEMTESIPVTIPESIPNEDPQAQQTETHQPHARAVRKLKRRKLDHAATLERYRTRISQLSTDALQSFLPEGCWLSTYDVWHCFTECPLNALETTSNAFVILEIARARGLNVRGVCTERRSNGELLSAPDDDGARVYVCRHNTFNSKQVHPVLSIQPHDKVYQDDDETTS